MNENVRPRLGCGLALVLLGGWLLAVRLIPSLGRWFDNVFDWPVFVIGTGVLLLLFGLVARAPGMAIPAAIVGGIGGLLYWQNATGNWESWAYAWTLIPGFVGTGLLLMGLLPGGGSDSLRAGGWLLVVSLTLFVVFGSFLGGRNLLGPYWPALLIVLGLVLLGRSFVGGRGEAASRS